MTKQEGEYSVSDLIQVPETLPYRGPRRVEGRLHVRALACVDDPTLWVLPAVRESMRWFYGEFLGLREAADARDQCLAFRFGRVRVWVRFSTSAEADPMRRRLLMEVADLDSTIEACQYRQVPWMPGATITPASRRVWVKDPGGHWIEMFQRWPL